MSKKTARIWPMDSSRAQPARHEATGPEPPSSSRGCPPRGAGRSREEVDERRQEGLQVVEIAAREPVTVLDDRTVNPRAARVADVVLDAEVAGERAARHQAGRD